MALFVHKPLSENLAQTAHDLKHQVALHFDGIGLNPEGLELRERILHVAALLEIAAGLSEGLVDEVVYQGGATVINSYGYADEDAARIFAALKGTS